MLTKAKLYAQTLWDALCWKISRIWTRGLAKWYMMIQRNAEPLERQPPEDEDDTFYD